MNAEVEMTPKCPQKNSITCFTLGGGDGESRQTDEHSHDFQIHDGRGIDEWEPGTAFYTCTQTHTHAHTRMCTCSHSHTTLLITFTLRTRPCCNCYRVSVREKVMFPASFDRSGEKLSRCLLARWIESEYSVILAPRSRQKLVIWFKAAGKTDPEAEMCVEVTYSV